MTFIFRFVNAIFHGPDISPIETARTRFLDIIVDHFIRPHVVDVVDSEADFAAQSSQDKMSKRKSREIHYEGDATYVLPLMYVANMYETLVNEVNVRLSSLNGMREKTIGVALEAAGGLYRKLAKKFPRKGMTYKAPKFHFDSCKSFVVFFHLIYLAVMYMIFHWDQEEED